MPTRRPGPRKELVEIPLPDGRFLRTEIDPTTGKHHVRCDRCQRSLPLPQVDIPTDSFVTERVQHVLAAKAALHQEMDESPLHLIQISNSIYLQFSSLDCIGAQALHIQLNVDAKSTLISRAQYIFEVPSVFIHPISPTIAISRICPDADNKLVWAISHTALHEHLEDAWQRLKPQNDEVLSNIHMLPSIVNPAALPYSDTTGNRWFYVKELPPNLVLGAKLKAKDHVHRFICGVEKPLSEMRDHVGKHILWEMRGQRPPQGEALKNPVGAFPCGFCGMDGCFTQIIDEKKGSKIKRTVRSNCIYHYEGMNYKAAANSSKNMPCTNIPIPCSLCPCSLSSDPQTIWKYSTMLHFIATHPAIIPIGNDGKAELHTIPDIPPDMVVSISISKKEEKRLGIQELITAEYREENELPGSDAITAMEHELMLESIAAKRGRAETLSVVEPTPKRKR